MAAAVTIPPFTKVGLVDTQLFKYLPVPTKDFSKYSTELELADNIVIIIPDAGEQRFICASDWTIKEAEDAIRREYGLSFGAIKINDTSTGREISTREVKSLAEEIQRVTRERIEILQFDGEKIRNSGGKEFIFTFVNGISEKELASRELAAQAPTSNYHALIRSGVVEDGYLVWNPPLYIDRYKKVQKIKIRECYPAIYELILESYRSGITNHLVTGVPGIGKSYFCLYFLWRYLTISDDKSVMLELTLDSIMRLTPSHTVSSNRNSCFDRDVPYLVDLAALQEPLLRIGEFTVVFSSPDPRRSKEFMKYRAQQYIMPVWSKDEIDDLHEKLFPAVDRERVEEIFSLVGGVPRLIFSERKDDVLGLIQKALNEKGVTIAKHCFTQGANLLDEDQSHLLIHLHPHPEQGYCTKSPLYMVATDIIWAHLSVVYSNVVLKKIPDTFDTGSLRGSSAGCIFERLCFEGMPLNGKSFTLLSLSQLNSQRKMSITIPSSIRKIYSNKTTSGVKLSAEMLYHPSARNFESGDAFYQDRSGALFVFQITVAQTHPVKAAGLDRICGLFNGVKNCHLVFVTPNNGRLNSQQSITTTSSEAIRRASSFVRKFESHQWKLEYAFSATSSSSTLHTQQEKRTRSGQSSVVVEEVEEVEESEPLPSRSRSRKKKQRTE